MNFKVGDKIRFIKSLDGYNSCFADFVKQHNGIFTIDYISSRSFIHIKETEDFVLTFNEIELYDERNDNVENDMNEVLKLYAKRSHQKLVDDFAKKRDEYINENEVVKELTYLQKEYDIRLAQLYNKYKDTGIIIIDDEDDYVIDDCKLINEFERLYSEEFEKESKKIDELCEEVQAQLSLSENLEYQIDVLIRYNIIDKKTKKIVIDDENIIK